MGEGSPSGLQHPFLLGVNVRCGDGDGSLEPDVKAALQELANADDRSLSSYINWVLRAHIGKRAKTKP